MSTLLPDFADRDDLPVGERVRRTIDSTLTTLRRQRDEAQEWLDQTNANAARQRDLIAQQDAEIAQWERLRDWLASGTSTPPPPPLALSSGFLSFHSASSPVVEIGGASWERLTNRLNNVEIELRATKDHQRDQDALLHQRADTLLQAITAVGNSQEADRKVLQTLRAELAKTPCSLCVRGEGCAAGEGCKA